MADVNINKFTTQILREGSTPSSPGFVVSEGQDPVDPSGSGQNHLPVTIAAAATGLSITESQVLGGAGTTSQYLRGDASLASFPDLTGFVPYTGANQTVNLNTQQLQAGHTTLTTNGSTETLTINHTSGSGKAINVTKGGAGEGLYVNKTSGSGNAATIVGTLEATTLKKTGGTSSQYLMADGSVSTLTNPVTGTGTTNYLPKFTGASTIGNSQIIDNGTNVGIGTNTPNATLSLYAAGTPYMNFRNATNISSTFGFVIEATGNNSELWNYANGYMRFGTNNIETIRLTSSNNILIGSPPAADNGARLQVSGTATFNSSVTVATDVTLNNGILYTSAGSGTSYSGRLSTAYIYPYITTYLDSFAGAGWEGRLQFRTNSAGGAMNTQMTILNSGSVGIGTPSPSNNAGFQKQLQIEGTYPGLTLKNVTGTVSWFTLGAGSAGDFGIFNNTTSTYPIYIPSTNNVLIGKTTDNGARLQVSGGINGPIMTLQNSSSAGYSGAHVLNNSSSLMGHFGFANASTGATLQDVMYFGSIASKSVVFTTSDVIRMTIDSSGNIGAPSGTNIYNASDLRFKKNISKISSGLDKINSLNPVKFNWVDGFVPSENDKEMLGFIAQEVFEIIPEAVELFGNNSITINNIEIKNPLRVNEKFIIPVLVKAIQELKQEIDTLKN